MSTTLRPPPHAGRWAAGRMYFPGDPLSALDPIYQSIADQHTRDRLVSAYDHDLSEPERLLGFSIDIPLGVLVVVTGVAGTRAR